MMRALPLILGATCLLAGCASADLTIKADLYRGETSVDRDQRLNRESFRQATTISNIRGSKAAAERCGAEIKSLAHGLEDVAVAYQGLYFELRKDLPDDESFNGVSARRDISGNRGEFLSKVDSAVQEVKDKADAVIEVYIERLAASIALQTLPDYQETRENNAKATKGRKPPTGTQKASDDRAAAVKDLAEKNLALLKAINELDDAHDQLVAQINRRDLTYTNNLITTIEGVSEGLPSLLAGDTGALAPLDGEQENQAQALARELGTLAGTLRSLSDDCIRVPVDTRSQVANLATTLSMPTAAGLQASVPMLIRNLQTIPASVVPGNAALYGIRDLARNQDFYISQLDRLQDPADPAWREILAKKNEENWGVLFAETTFQARGKSDVIVVRDRPGHYRVQRGVNNPAALIQGQLEISRSVASATTAVLGAVSGVRVPLLTEGQGGSGEADDEGTQAQPPAPSNVGAAARVEAEAEEQAQRARAAARTALVVEVQSAVRQLQAIGAPDTTESTRRNQIYKQLAPVLRSYAELLRFTVKTEDSGN